MNDTDYKGHKAFWYKTSWYHRKKVLNPDGTVTYTKQGGFDNPYAAEESYDRCEEEFKNAQAKALNPKIETDIMLKDYIKCWFENDYRKRIENTTAMITSFAIYNLILPNIINDTKVRYVTTEYLDAILEKISYISKSSGNKAREVLLLALEDAFRDGIIPNNPVRDTKKYRKSKSKIVLLNKAEIKKLLIVAKKDNNWYLEILIGLFCGLRKGEIFGLKFDDFNLDNKSVTIQRQTGASYEIGENEYKVKLMGVVEKGPKTQNSYRTIPVPQVVLDELEKRKMLVDYYKMTNEDFEDHNYISCRPDGRAHSLTSFNGYLVKACLRATIPRITVHSLRHMYATILLEQGESLEKISALLGHSSIHTTFDYYCDVMNANDEITAYMNNQFSYEDGD